MKKLFFIFAAIAMCLLASCDSMSSSKTLHVAQKESADVMYTLCYRGRELTITEQKSVKESMINMSKRNLSAAEAKKELQKILTKDCDKSVFSLVYVSRSEWHDEHSNYAISHNWTGLYCFFGIIAAFIILCIIIYRIKRKNNDWSND